MRGRLRTALVVALPALAALGACGGTLYTAAGVPAVVAGQCSPTEVACDVGLPQPVCTDLSSATQHCGACNIDCNAGAPPPSGAVLACVSSSCTFHCPPGLLKVDAGANRACAAPTALAAGDAHTCAIAAGRLHCWGSNAAGQVPSAASSVVLDPFDAGIDGVTAVAAGAAHTCAVVAGAVECWPASAGVGMPALTGTITALSAGASHTCALHDGAVDCWGSAIVVAPPLSGIVAITSGSDHACALHGPGATAGEVDCWGTNGRSQTGGGTPIAAGSGMTQIAAGHDFTCAANFDATASPASDLLCWGDNTYGQLPALLNPQPTPATPQRTGGGGGPRPITKGAQLGAMTAGARHLCVSLPAPDGIGCFGESTFGKLGISGPFPGEIVTLGASSVNVTLVAGGGNHTCARFSTGELRCWGANDSGQLGNGVAFAGDTPSPVQVSGR